MEKELYFNSETQECNFKDIDSGNYIFHCTKCNYCVMGENYEETKNTALEHSFRTNHSIRGIFIKNVN